jgi:PAS domain S-box-containing protein
MIRLLQFKDRINATPAIETILAAAASLRRKIISQMYRLLLFVGAGLAATLVVERSLHAQWPVLVLVFCSIAGLSLFSVTREILKYLSSLEKSVLEKVSERELLYLDLYDNAPDLLLSVESSSGRIIQCNKTLLRVLGYDESEVIGHHVMSLYHPESRVFVQRLFDQFLQTGSIEDVELLVRKKDGSYIDVSLNSSAVRDLSGKILYSRSSWRDVTKRKVSETELRVLIETVPQFVWSCRPNGELDFVNQRWLDYTGCRPGIDSYVEIIHPDDRVAVMENWQRALKDETPFEGEFRFRHHIHGTYRWFLVRALPVRLASGVVKTWFGVSVDVDDMKVAKEQQIQAAIREHSAEESSRLKSEFLAVVSHEIRTPLNGVVGMTELMLGENLSDRQKEYAKIIHDSSEVLLTLINDILDFSKIESGRMDLDKIEFDPRALSTTLESEQLWAAQAKGLKLAFNGFGNLPSVVIGDPMRLRQVLTNLITNALKFTDTGRVEVTSQVIEKTVRETTVRFSVEDTGIGIEESKLDRLFKPFSQIDSSSTRTSGGTGLGLSICKRLVELMGSQIQVESTYRKGSRFSFTVAFANASQSQQIPAPIKIETDKTIYTAKILVADDVPVNRKVMELYLHQLGHEVVAVESGITAIEALERDLFDLVLLDCQMPEKDGYETAQEIREHPSIWVNQIPLVAISANASVGEIEKCIASGMNDYLAKPVRIGTLKTKCNQWIQKSLMDWTTFEDLEVLDPAAFQTSVSELIALFEAGAPERLRAIETAVRSGHPVEIRRSTHALKSASSYVGAVKVARYCDWICDVMTRAPATMPDQLLENLRFEVERTLSMLHSRFN